MKLKEAREIVAEWREMDCWKDTAMLDIMITLDDRITELEGRGDRFCKTIQHLQHERNVYRKRIEGLDKQRDELRALLLEIHPQFYGMLLKEFGHPKDWPTYGAAGVITYEKIQAITYNWEKQPGVAG